MVVTNEDALNYLNARSDEAASVSTFVNQFEKMVNNVALGNHYSFEENDEQFNDDFNKLLSAACNLHTEFVPYSEITRIIYGLQDELGMDFFMEAFKKQIRKRIQNNSSELSNEYVILIKVSEHVNLARKQKDSLYRKQAEKIGNQENSLKQLRENTEKETKRLRKLKQEMKTIKDMKSSIYGDFIAILGIFSALIFSLFGGFDTLSKVVSQVSMNVRLYRIMISVALLGMILVSLLFFLLKAVATMSGKSIATNLKGNVFRKYPFFMVTITVLIITFVFGVCVDLFRIFCQ
ncbi:hypothetical protein EFQ23_04730 [Limosilactobacillus fermentum]|uniref:hypothetical protein n=1 Tax=Limosilactobacillus fermentum TaxID=1613 RepID=UPI000710A0CE|nr:hypothetical protein [Limosilactobacillus fermentum]KRN13810.1 hypothetical protein IV46_GL000663 [Limosilactobacillus fermentum]MCH5388921.1 hypothetical protein [Limosilactobacillus fermentum]MCH5393458.1 hypothetical protein [Limosilactobacillus fermentum]MCT3435439.1 hypothetical protein [Limosilactobacillus fermentum]PPX65683.1 hypothetical protein C5O28_06080 [Limosilactobacillus fermentum]